MTNFVYIITGAGSGIGAAIANRLATNNALLIIHTKQNTEGLEQVAQDCRAKGVT